MPPTSDNEKSREQLLAELAELRAEIASLRRSDERGNGGQVERQEDDESRVGEARLRLILDAVTAPISYVDAAERYCFNNKAYDTWLGRPHAELRGKSMLEVLGEPVYDEVNSFIEEALSGKETKFERSLLYPDGSTRYVQVAFTPDVDERGVVHGFVISVGDLTERMRAEETLRTAEQRAFKEYEQLLNRLTHLAESLGTALDHLNIFRDLRDFACSSVPCIGIFISLYDPERDVRVACYAWGDDEEVDVSQLPPMPITKEGPNSRAVRTGRIVITNNDYMNTQRGHPSVVIGTDNGLRPQSSMIVPMATMGRIVGTVEVQSYEAEAYKPEHVTAMRMAANLAAVAIENMRLLEHETSARAAAEESSRLKDEFLAMLSHELRTPLTAILGWSNMLRAGQLDEATRKTAAEIIERNARSQQQLIDDILDVSRIVTGYLRFNAEPMDVRPVVRAAIDTMRPAATARRIELQALFDPQLGPVIGDARRLQQVVWNLLANAIKFTPIGGRVNVSVERAASHVRITVADTGVGIKSGFLPFVFDRFRQGDQSPTRAFGGLGLGLAIVRHLVELHGGTVRASSDGEGHGATFVVELPSPVAAETTFPVSTRDAGALPRTAPDARDPDSPPALMGMRVLVVDDERDTLDLIELILRQNGAEVTSVTSAGAAVAALAEVKPDVLLSDIGMPGEDGYSLLRRVRALGPELGGRTPAIALTAYAGEPDRVLAFAAGFQLHVPKPIDPAELVAMIATLAAAGEKV
ncbi:MAG TPA: ATP-binding protein [Pyrinomonadaceae bacterium]|nr:ATP-binding protein [Pyrinomonadaceae bacterium]